MRSSWPFTDVANEWVGISPTRTTSMPRGTAAGDHYRDQLRMVADRRTLRVPEPEPPRVAVLANADELKALLDGFLAVKARHVRDAAFWGAPVGTPLPYRRRPTRHGARRVVNADGMRDEYMRIATEKVTPERRGHRPR